MDLNTIIGAVIAIISSSIALWIMHIFNIKEANNKRKWELEDEKRNNRKEIYFQRLNQLEEYFKYYGKMASIYKSMININTTKDEIIKEGKLDRFPNFMEETYLLSIIIYFDDEELLTYVEDLTDRLKNIKSTYNDFSNKIINDEVFDRAEFISKKSKLSISDVYSKVLKRIDYLKNNYSNEL